MRRRRLPPDKRLDWRDPDMPVLRRMEHPMTGEPFLGPVPPKDEQDYHAGKMRDPQYDRAYPSYSRDPVYDLKRKRSRR